MMKRIAFPLLTMNLILSIRRKEVTATIIKDIFDVDARIIEGENDHRPVVVF